MKKCVTLCLILLLILSLASCSPPKSKNDIADYQYIYDVVDDWNKQTFPLNNRENIFGYGEYLYNSHLILFPRETPSSLTDFYYYWSPLIDFDDYAIYFTCQPTRENYEAFVKGLSKFTVTSPDGKVYAPLYDNEHFSLPAYILQWNEPNRKTEILEYILLDDSHHTVVFVYTMSCLNKIEENSDYTVTPTDFDLIPSHLMEPSSGEDTNGIIDYEDIVTGFSIYGGFDGGTYDISFLDYLM